MCSDSFFYSLLSQFLPDVERSSGPFLTSSSCSLWMASHPLLSKGLEIFVQHKFCIIILIFFKQVVGRHKAILKPWLLLLCVCYLPSVMWWHILLTNPSTAWNPWKYFELAFSITPWKMPKFCSRNSSTNLCREQRKQNQTLPAVVKGQ